MAESKLYNTNTKDLTECGICLMTIEEPKALPCLHSFCLKCLSKWAKGKKDTIRCPICSQDFPIPPEGIKGFITNFVINTLKDRREILAKLHAKDARIPCSCCGETDSKVEAYCTECGGFICEGCGVTHRKLLILQDHNPIPFGDLQSGRVDIKKVMKQQCCKEHKGQVLQFYCKTCGVLICQGCTVVDHQTSTHSLVNLKHATKEQRSEVQQLMGACSKVEGMVNDSLKSTDKVQEDLGKSYKKAIEDVQQAGDKVKANVLAEIDQMVTHLKSEITQAAAVNKKQIEAQKESLQMQQTRLQTALQMGTEVTQTGSDHDLALVFSFLKDNLNQLRIMKPGNVDSTFGELEFTANQSVLSPVASLGSLMVGRSNKTPVPLSPVVKEGSKPWKLIKQFADKGTHTLRFGQHIAVTSNSEFVVVAGTNGQAFVHDQSGNFKYSLDTKQGLKSGQTSYPWNVVVSPYGMIFITHRVSHVNVYDRNGTYTHRFPTKSPSNVSSDAQYTDLRGLALDNQACLLVGEVQHQYISKHRLDGSHVSSINVKMKPWYIAVTSTDKIVVSCGWESLKIAQILDPTGNVLHTFNRPSGVSSWYPCGIYCTAGDEICIANSIDEDNGGGIYCYSESGQCIGHVTCGYCCRSMVLTENGNKFIVVEQNCVKIFSRQ